MPGARTIGSVLAAAAAVVVVASGLAALRHAGNELCLYGAGALERQRTWLPYGTRCRQTLDDDRILVVNHGPSDAAFLAWLAATAALLGAVVWRRRSWPARAVASSACVVALLAALWHEFGEYQFAMLGASVFGVPLAFAVDRLLLPRPRRAVTAGAALLAMILPFAAVAAWTVPGFIDESELGVVAALVLAAGLARTFELLARLNIPD
jgi:hypothetical protein